MGGGKVGEFGMDMDRLLYLEWITSKGLLYGAWNSAQYYTAALDGGEVLGEWILVYVWQESLCCSRTIMTGCTPIQNNENIQYSAQVFQGYCNYGWIHC